EDPKGPREVRKFEGHNGEIHRVALSPDGRRALTGAGKGDQKLRLFDVQTGEKLLELTGHTDARGPLCVAFRSDGRAVSCGRDAIRVWDLKEGKPLGHFSYNDGRGAEYLAVSPGGQYIATGRGKADVVADVVVWNMQTRKEQFRLRGHEGGSRAAAFAPDGRIATGDNKGKIRLWDANGRPLANFNAHHNAAVVSVEFSPDGKDLLTGGLDNAIRFWPGGTGKAVLSLVDKSFNLFRADFAPDGRRAVAATWDGVLRVYDLREGVVRYRWPGHAKYVTDAVFTPDGKFVLSVSGDQTMRLWELATGGGVVKPPPPPPPVDPPAVQN